MDATHVESSADINLANEVQEKQKQQPPTTSQLDDVLPESYERTYIPDGELQVPVRVPPKPRNQRRPFPAATMVTTDGNQHFPLPVAINGSKHSGVRRRTVSAPARGAAKAAKAGRRAISRKASLAALPPIKKGADGEHPPLSSGTVHNTRSKALLTKDSEEPASISTRPRLFIRIPARKAVEKQREARSNAKENPSVVEVSSAKQTNKKTNKMSIRSADKLEAPKAKATEVNPAAGRLKRKELHEDNNRANPKGTDKRAKKNGEVPVEGRPKIILRIPKRPTPVVDLETAAGGSKVERERKRDQVDEPNLRRSSRQKMPTWKMRSQ